MVHVLSAVGAKTTRKATMLLGILMVFVYCSIFTWAEGTPPNVHAKDDGLALTPPMGWYPWNIFGQEPQNEKLIEEIVDSDWPCPHAVAFKIDLIQ